jgi:hypothetical protein
MHLAGLSAVAERLVCTMLCAGALAASASATTPAAPQIDSSRQTRPAYCDGKIIDMNYVPGRRNFKIGPWNISAQVQREKPRDPHPNLYIVAPGTQYVDEGAEQYSHNEVLSLVPLKSDPVEWDVYFAIVLDPSLHEDFRSEQQLIFATQDEFEPAGDLKLGHMPGAAFLQEYLHIDSLEGLKKYRRPDGELPRLIIVPAKVTVKASAVDPDASPEPVLKSTLPTMVHASALAH